jgi:hypothetical protein
MLETPEMFGSLPLDPKSDWIRLSKLVPWFDFDRKNRENFRVDPYHLPDGTADAVIPEVIVRHGESVITLPAGSNAEAIAELVKALNRHAVEGGLPLQRIQADAWGEV